MKCLSCGNTEFEESTVNVEGKIYGLVIKTEKKKRKIKAVVCKNCKMVYFKQDEGKYK
jgi:predicted nucleic-acid-binding Zn-ribbon protein